MNYQKIYKTKAKTKSVEVKVARLLLFVYKINYNTTVGLHILVI